jgi:hypothetical protein
MNALLFFSGHAIPCTTADLLACDPVQQALLQAADIGRNGYRRSPQRWLLPAMLLVQAYRPRFYSQQKLLRLFHGPIFSKSGASAKPRAVHIESNGKPITNDC